MIKRKKGWVPSHITWYVIVFRNLCADLLCFMSHHLYFDYLSITKDIYTLHWCIWFKTFFSSVKHGWSFVCPIFRVQIKFYSKLTINHEHNSPKEKWKNVSEKVTMRKKRRKAESTHELQKRNWKRKTLHILYNLKTKMKWTEKSICFCVSM